MSTLFSVLGIILLLICGAIVVILLVLLALGAMHQHMLNKGHSFGRDNELHAKVDQLMENQHNATFTTKH